MNDIVQKNSILKTLFSKRHLRLYFLYGGLAALGYVGCAVVFIVHNQFEYTWWLYVGNMMFMFFILLHARKLAQLKDERLGNMDMLAAGEFATGFGIAIALFFSLIALLIIQPAVFTPTHSHPMIDAPAQVRPERGGTDIAFMIFLNATVVNACIGSFIALIASYAVKRKKGRG